MVVLFWGGSFNAIYTTDNRIFCVVNCNKPSKKSVLSFVLFLFSLLYVGSDSLVCVSVHAPLQSMDAHR